MLKRLPIRIHQPLRRQCAFQHVDLRPFSATTARPGRKSGNKKNRVDPILNEVSAKHQGGQAPSTLYKQMMGDEKNLPDDIGLLPGTFIRAGWRQLPGIFSPQRKPDEPWYTRYLPGVLKREGRLWYEWKWLSATAKAMLTLYLFRRRFQKPRPKLFFMPWNRNELKSIAREKYKYLYQSFAKGDNQAISKMCLDSVASDFRRRIDNRRKGLIMVWKLNRFSSVRIISNRTQALDVFGDAGTGIQQVIFRIKSDQNLQLSDGPSKNGVVVEHMAMQRYWVRGVVKEWKIWGFPDTMDVAGVLKQEDFEKQLNAHQTEGQGASA